MPKNVFYAQSGGVTAVINASACGVLETARQYPEQFGTVFAGRDGILGALTEDLLDTSKETDAAIARLRHTPGGAFGSCRYKLKSDAARRRLLEVFAAHDVGYFFYNGGNDSMDTALKVAELARQEGVPLVTVGIPKTVDNDLAKTDCCPGFGSAAKYVATSMREAGFDVASMARTSTKIFVLEVMGRHAGWLTAACGLAAAAPGDAPHLLLFPEIPFAPEVFLPRVEAAVKAHGYCAIAVSEGLRDAAGNLLSSLGGQDAFGHAQLGGVGQSVAQLIQERLGHKYHWALADYLQRSARHIASQTDVDQAYAVGREAVLAARSGHNAVMPAIHRLSDAPYRWEITLVPLAEVANVERKMPREFITEDGFGVTEVCRRYLLPLLEGEAFPPFAQGLPDYARLTPPRAEKKLADFSVE
ncbi:MAG: 6-phosphofructokinase [Zoogloeaceae bacterium]|jgi:6-phosphofructokinase 1|nr:6-phosphofructokinase [Zoogloeaceae bacterium]